MTRAGLSLVILIVSIAPHPLTPEPRTAATELIVWNVGQGLWTTLLHGERCLHFDTGGEHAPWRLLHEKCGDKINIVHFSHWDLDHISFAARLPRRIKSVCLQTPPAGDGNARKKKILEALATCSRSEPITNSIEGRTQGRHANDLSHVFLTGEPQGRALALLPGDSTQREEKHWARHLPAQRMWLLILGHHGSRTSTSVALLRQLPRVHMAVASSRQAKYGHPHHQVARRLRTSGIALLRTEDWGTLRFEVPKSSPPERAGSSVSRITDDRACIRGSNCGRQARKSHGHRRR